jgi:hypothetical protein
LVKNYGKLTAAAYKQGDVWHKKITAIVNQRKSDIEKMKGKHVAVLEKYADEITRRLSQIKQNILELKNLLVQN